MKKNNVVMMALLVAVVSTNSFSQETYRQMASRHMATAGEGISNAATYAGKKLRYGKKMVSSGLSEAGQWISANATWAMDTVKGYSRTQQLALVGAIATLLGGAVVIAYLKTRGLTKEQNDQVDAIVANIKSALGGMDKRWQYDELVRGWNGYVNLNSDNTVNVVAINRTLEEFFANKLNKGATDKLFQITEKDVQALRPTTSWWNSLFGEKTDRTVS
jgi:hypothetical protein